MQTVPFPLPVRLGVQATRWRLSDLETYEARIAGEPDPPPRDRASDRYLSVRQVADRYGASVPSVWRWTAQARQEVA